MIYATRGLIAVLLNLAAEQEPQPVTVSLAVTPAAEFDDGFDIPPDASVFTHFYFPDAAGSLNAVFGMDLGIPIHRIQGRLVSHPHGRRQQLRIFDALPAHEAIPKAPPVSGVSAGDDGEQ